MNRYRQAIGFRRQQEAQARKEKAITLYLGLIVIVAVLFTALMAGDALIPIEPAEIYMANDNYLDVDILDIPVDVATCGKYLCISMTKMLFIRDDDMIFLINN